MLSICLGMLDTEEEKITFEDLYHTYKGKMFSLANRILKNHHNAEEAVSSIMEIRDMKRLKRSPLF